MYETKIFTTGMPNDSDVSLYALELLDKVDELWKGLYPSILIEALIETELGLTYKRSLPAYSSSAGC